MQGAIRGQPALKASRRASRQPARLAGHIAGERSAATPCRLPRREDRGCNACPRVLQKDDAQWNHGGTEVLTGKCRLTHSKATTTRGSASTVPGSTCSAQAEACSPGSRGRFAPSGLMTRSGTKSCWRSSAPAPMGSPCTCWKSGSSPRSTRCPDRTPRPGRGRGVTLTLTSEGQGLHERVWAVYEEAIHAEIGNRMTTGEAYALARLLIRLYP